MAKKIEKIKLWSSVTVGLIALAFTYPVGALLAATNAHRLGDTEKKKKYIRYGGLFILVFFIFGYYVFGGGITSMGWVVNAFMAYTLFNETKKELEKRSAEENILLEPWWKALLIGVGVFVAAGFFYLLFALLMMQINAQ